MRFGHQLGHPPLALPVAHGCDHEDVAVGRQLELRLRVDRERLEQRTIDHEREAVAGSREPLRHVRTVAPDRPDERRAADARRAALAGPAFARTRFLIIQVVDCMSE